MSPRPWRQRGQRLGFGADFDVQDLALAVQVAALALQCVCSLCFFFQAEDGIRDVAVTGVQTCALPIYDQVAEGAGLVDGLLDLIVALREDARKRKDFATADRIRDALAAVGVVLEDTHDGVRWKRK